MRRWLAHLITVGNTLCGTTAVFMTFDGHPVLAGWLIILAAVLDAFDGKVARFFGSGSEFGIHFDSMADVISFGIAPAVLVYSTAFQDLGVPGLLVCAVPVVLTAVRLARFNITADGRHHDFIGLSSPLHACLIASFVVMNYAKWGEIADSNMLAGLVLLSGLLMVSHYPFPGLPRFSLKEPGFNLIKLILFLGFLGFMAIKPARHTFPALTLLIVTGFVVQIVRSAMGRSHAAEEFADDEEAEEASMYRGQQ